MAEENQAQQGPAGPAVPTEPQKSNERTATSNYKEPEESRSR